MGIHGRSGHFVDALGLLCGSRPAVAVAAAPAPPPPLDVSDSRDNVNLPGSDYASFVPEYADATPCWAACADDPKCKSYSWVKPNAYGQGPTGRCYLKDTVPASVTDTCCESGLKGQKHRLIIRARALNDVDIYDGPGGDFNIIGILRAGARAGLLERGADGWCKLDCPPDPDSEFAGGPGWVHDDHLDVKCRR